MGFSKSSEHGMEKPMLSATPAGALVGTPPDSWWDAGFFLLQSWH